MLYLIFRNVFNNVIILIMDETLAGGYAPVSVAGSNLAG